MQDWPVGTEPEMRAALVERHAGAVWEPAAPIAAQPTLVEQQIALLISAALMSIYLSDYPTARSLLEESLSISAKFDLEYLTRHAQLHMGNVARMVGDYAYAQCVYRECVRASQGPEQEIFLANSLWSLGNATAESGELESGELLLRQGLDLGRKLRDTYVVHGALRDLGMILSYRGDYEEAVSCLEESLALARHAKFRLATSWTLSALGFAVMGLGTM